MPASHSRLQALTQQSLTECHCQAGPWVNRRPLLLQVHKQGDSPALSPHLALCSWPSGPPLHLLSWLGSCPHYCTVGTPSGHTQLQLYSKFSSTKVFSEPRPPTARPPSLFSGHPHLDLLQLPKILLFMNQRLHVSSGFLCVEVAAPYPQLSKPKTRPKEN